MKDAAVVEEHKITWLDAAGYRSRWFVEQLGKPTIRCVILFEARALEGKRRNRAIVVANGAELPLGIDVEHGALGNEFHPGVCKTIENGNLRQRGEGVGILGA